MPISISSSFKFELDRPTDVLLQFEAAIVPEQRLIESDTWITASEHFARVPGQDDIGERIWLRGHGLIEVDYTATVEPSRVLAPLDKLKQLPAHLLPGETVKYLLDSRYCSADQFQNFVNTEFSGSVGGERIAAIRDWIANYFTYAPGTSSVETGAAQSFIARQGICRDYAHVMVALARASTIPARYVACYAPGVTPQDFHAQTEVFLADPDNPEGGAWHLVDATRMAEPAQTAKIGVGRDAADVSFLTTFGPNRFISSCVKVEAE